MADNKEQKHDNRNSSQEEHLNKRDSPRKQLLSDSSSVKSINKVADNRTLFVKFHPPSATITRQHLSDHFSNYGPVNRCSVIRQSRAKEESKKNSTDLSEDGSKHFDRGSKGYGFVRFVHDDDAKSAAEFIQNENKLKKEGYVMIVDGVKYRIFAERAVDATTSSISKTRGHLQFNGGENISKDIEGDLKRKRTSRVIIRNLSFHANQSHIKKAMEASFGPVAAVDLPLVPILHGDGNRGKNTHNNTPRHRGFAFVTFVKVSSAKMAVELGNKVKIKNRLVAIDFSISKAAHQTKSKERMSETRQESDNSSESESEITRDKVNESGEDNSDESSVDEDNSEEHSESDSESVSAEAGNRTDYKKSSNSTDCDEKPKFDENEACRTLFVRNIPFDATRHDLFELLRQFGYIEAVYLVRDPLTGIFRGTAFVRFQTESGCRSALKNSGNAEDENSAVSSSFVSSKNIAMGLGQEGMSGLTLKGRKLLMDLAVDRTTASSLTVQRDADGKPIKKMIGKDRRNLYLKNEGRVASSADSAAASAASAKYGGIWEDLPPNDRSKRERAFADKSAKLRSPLFFINPTRLSIRNLAKHIKESDLKDLVGKALRTGLDKKVVTPNDAVAHWRAGGELAHSEVMRRATEPDLVTPPFDEKNTKRSILSVFIDRDLSGGKKAADAPSRGFGFVEFTHHIHALACLRQLNNNPVYSEQFASGGKYVAGVLKQQQRRGRKKMAKVDEAGSDFVADDGKIRVPRLIVEFAVENKVKARQQSERIAQKKANRIKQRNQNKEKQPPEKKEKKKSRGALQREKKRARKESGEKGDNMVKTDNEAPKLKKFVEPPAESNGPGPLQNPAKPRKKRKIDAGEQNLEKMIESYKASFSRGETRLSEKSEALKPQKMSRVKIGKRRWFE